MKVRIQFSKSGPLRFVGHLDFLRGWGQALRRSGLPLAFSQGFNPHILLGFALPLPLGMASVYDYADLTFAKQICLIDAAEQLRLHVPEGLIIHRMVENTGRNAAAVTAAADYVLPISGANTEIKKNVEELLAAKEWVIPKKTKSGIKKTDIRPDIFAVSLSDKEVTMRLAAGSGRFLNPVTVAEIVAGRKVSVEELIRLELYEQVGEVFKPLYINCE
jgi:radical SAM-linked protein